MPRRIAACFATVVLLLTTPCARGEVTLPAIISDHMVLQMGHELTIWGWAEAGEEVTVTLMAEAGDPKATESAMTIASAEGTWSVKLPPRTKVSLVDLTIAGKNTITLTDILIGDVWVCSGQSNMEWPVNSSSNHQEEIADAKHPAIRLFKVERSTARVPQTHLEGKWIECSPESIPEFSAVAYFFGRELHQRLKRPVGLVQVALSGANCEAWTSMAALKTDDDFAKILERADKAISDPNQANNPNRASVLYNGMIAPLQPMAIKGTIWYQGESNAGRAYQYRKLFPLMITDWRRRFGQGDFPFLFVQLPNFVSEKTKPDHPAEPEESTWAELREAQSKALALPKTSMVVTIDIGDPRDIHPKNKQDIGRRLALSAMKVAYGQDVIASGPEFKSMKIVGHEAHIEFQHVGGGLVVHGDSLKGFTIAGADKRFVWATARIDGNRVIVSAPNLAEPIAVRYAWGDNPDCNLFNQSSLPAAPFRTDDWPGLTMQNK